MNYYYIVLCLIYCPFVLSFNADDIYNEPQYKLLPPIYRMENFYECTKNKHLFCEIGLELNPQNNNSDVWHIIKQTIDSRYYLPRNILRRALCLPKNVLEDNETTIKVILEKVKDEIEDLNLTANVRHVHCNWEVGFSLYDYTLICITTVYLSFMAWSTYTDYKTRQKIQSDKEENVQASGTLVRAFSLISNYERFKTLPKSPDYNRLKCMQGLRCSIIFLIIMGHSLYSHMYGYLENPYKIERHIGTYHFQIFTNMGMYQVQIFLLMSGWLMALQILTIKELFKKYTLSHAMLLYLNRYLRLLPVVGVMIAFHTSAVPLFLFQSAPFSSKLVERTHNCEEKWWKTLLFIHNNEPANTICESGTWYIGVDSQMYFISLFILYVIIKYKTGIKTLMKLAVACCVLYGSLIYYYETEFFCRITPARLQFGQAEISFDFLLLYISTYSSASTFFVGIIFGWIYYKYKNVDFNLSVLWNIPWFIIFVGLPWLVLHISTYEIRGIYGAIIGAIVKPIFAFAFGIGILGMANNIGGPIKKFFEWKGFEYFANITFSLYIFHFDVVFPRSILTDTPLVLYKPDLVMNFFFDLATSITIGFTIYMILELPCSNVIKIFMKKLMDKEKKKEN